MSKPYVCPKCDGWKRVPCTQDSMTTAIYEMCPVCNGMGVLWLLDLVDPGALCG